MSETFLQQALEIVKAQASVRSMTEEEIVQMVSGLSKALGVLVGDDAKEPETVAPPADKGIKSTSITCLECGKKFKIITKKHLASHGLSAAEYRAKWGLKRDTSLVCKKLQKVRRDKMKSMQLWTKRKQAAATAVAPAKKVRARVGKPAS
ncbi:MAG: MucR family transcriptional regulator [Desulfovibrio sp.]|jgi:predicted transcriptional regulator|nr:MucR family transcriptional regulator [Desulfovibrio sp.]